jgi:hypothetical protein
LLEKKIFCDSLGKKVSIIDIGFNRIEFDNLKESINSMKKLKKIKIKNEFYTIEEFEALLKKENDKKINVVSY